MKQAEPNTAKLTDAEIQEMLDLIERFAELALTASFPGLAICAMYTTQVSLESWAGRAGIFTQREITDTHWLATAEPMLDYAEEAIARAIAARIEASGNSKPAARKPAPAAGRPAVRKPAVRKPAARKPRK